MLRPQKQHSCISQTVTTPRHRVRVNETNTPDAAWPGKSGRKANFSLPVGAPQGSDVGPIFFFICVLCLQLAPLCYSEGLVCFRTHKCLLTRVKDDVHVCGLYFLANSVQQSTFASPLSIWAWNAEAEQEPTEQAAWKKFFSLKFDSSVVADARRVGLLGF